MYTEGVSKTGEKRTFFAKKLKEELKQLLYRE